VAGRPNVLFIVADDLNGWISPLRRHPGVKTPHIEALAARGTLFEHAYCAAPHCNPSRASVFSGLRPTTTGVYVGEPLVAPTGFVTLPELFREAGYSAFGAGKVFHGQYDYRAAVKRYATMARWRDLHNDPGFWDEFHACAPEPLPSGRPLNRMFDFGRSEQVPDWYCHFDWGPLPPSLEEALPDRKVVERCREFLRRDHRQPFFCAAGLYRPHLPWYVPQRYFDLHPLAGVALPDVRDDELEGVPEIALAWAREPDDHPLIVARDQWKPAVQGYLASMSFCDELIGELVAALDESGHGDDTIVVLWGDNGFHLGEKLHWRKFTLWEEATRVPLLVCAPGRSQAGHRYEAPVSLLDLYPTLAELAGLTPPAGLEGESLAPWLAPNPAPRTSRPIATWGAGNHSVRAEHWRYTRYRDGSEELYDHRSDPRERDNLARRSGSRGVIEQLAPWLEGLGEGLD
jgi:arylsulfatase A-like enzyme